MDLSKRPARLARSLLLSLVAAAALALGAACDDPAKNAPRAPSTPGGKPESSAKPALTVETDDWSLKKPAPSRLVAIGDLHGDLERTKRVLRLAGAVDANINWSGGSMIVVQVGDQIDRGDGDREILDLTERLQREARAAGGDFVSTLGNHELMNVQLDFRYVTPGAAKSFDEFAKEAPPQAASQRRDFLGRAGAFAPGHPYAMKLADRPLLAWIGDSVFVHGGVLPKHLKFGLVKADRETREWLRGERSEAPKTVVGEDGLVWARHYSASPGPRECEQLSSVLESLGAKRMVVGHTVQSGGLTEACDGKVRRIDCGMSAHYGGPIQALEISGDDVKVLKEAG
jgi:hypothetical protein